MKAKYRLEQFERVLELRNRDNLPYLLIGGQAVNFWADLYAAREPALVAMRPFTSEDIDFKGDRADVEHIAAQLKLRAVLPGRVGMTALAGSIPFAWGDIQSNIEVVRSVPGAPQNIEKTAIQIEAHGHALRVMDPVSLFASKLELCASVSQENRQDVRHLKMLVHCVRHFLGDLVQGSGEDEIDSRTWLNIVGFLLKRTATKPAKRVSKELEVDWNHLLPWEILRTAKDPKLIRFVEGQRNRSQG
jgi:hypothetical protein